MARSRTPVNVADTARRLAAQRELWRLLVDYDPITRYYARLASEPGWEAWLLTWLPGQGTPWHDHGESAGSFVVLHGVLTESVAAPDRPDPDAGLVPRATTEHGEGDQRAFGRHYVHRVVNNGLDPAASLHVYSPKLVTMTDYDETRGRLLPRQTRLQGVDW